MFFEQVILAARRFFVEAQGFEREVFSLGSNRKILGWFVQMIVLLVVKPLTA